MSSDHQAAGDEGGGDERRQHRRWPLKLPVRVQSRNPDGSLLEEMTSCDDASPGGVSLLLRQPVRQGQVLHLSLPLPSRFRQYDVTSQSYRVYGLVRSVMQIGGGFRVGVLFYGRHPPHGAESLPRGLYLLEGDPRPGSATRTSGIPVVLRLEAEQAPGGLEREEETVAHPGSGPGARVRVRTLPVMKGMILFLREVSGVFTTRAEVDQILIGADGDPRVDLVFLDGLAPDHWGAQPAGS
jgi:hypothetical protein